MVTIKYKQERYMIFTVLSDGKFHTEVTAETEGAVKREYETSDGTKGTKYEHLANEIEGVITNLSIYEGDYGKQVQILIDKEVTISLSTQTPFGEDFLKKIPNIDVSLPVRLVPYAFDDEKTVKKRRGLTVYQKKGEEEIKVQDSYHSKDLVTEKIIAINGYPEVPDEAKDWDSEDWKLYFGMARKYMIEQLRKHPLFDKEKKIEATRPAITPENYPTEQIDPSSIPF